MGNTEFKSYKLTEYNSIAEIPIYRLNPTQFEDELNKSVNKICHSEDYFMEFFPKNGKEKYLSHRVSMEAHISYLWKYNEIIGFVLLNFDDINDILSGDLFYKDSKRIVKGGKSKIEYHGEAFRFENLYFMSNEMIFNRIIEEFRKLTQNGKLKGRYIDLNAFQTTGKFIDWGELIRGFKL